MSFRKFARLAGVLATLFPFATCTDFTGPSSRGVQLPIAPTFSHAATFAKALYSLAGLDYDRVRIVVSRDTQVLKDTTVDFTAASADLTLPLTIAADPGEMVTATLEYRNATMALYSGSVLVRTVAVGAPDVTATPIVIVPVGPGSSAASVVVSPNGGHYPTTSPVSLTAQAFTSDATAIPGALFAWSVDDETIATVDAEGIVHPTSKGGTVHVRATTLNEVFGEASITFVTAPASLALQSGGAQAAMAFEALPAPVVVKVLDANGLGVPGIAVHFAVAIGNGSISVADATTDAEGLVSTTWTLGDVVGTQSITATAAALPDAPLTIDATATERPAVTLAYGQQPANAVMGAAIMPAVTVQALDDHGRVVTGFTGAVTMTFDANPGSATLNGTLTENAVAGVATFSDLSVSAAGTGYTLQAASTGLTSIVSNSFDVAQVPSGLSLFAGGSQTATIRSTLSQIVVKVADANGVGAAGVTVDFAVATGGGSIVVDNAVTDAQGLARATWTLGSTIGEQSITATSEGLSGSPLTITAEATPLPAIGLAFVQQPTVTAVNAAMTPAVAVRAIDADGNTVAGFTGTVSLTLQANPTSATLGGTTSVAAVAGVATFTNLSLNAVGSGYTLAAAATGLTSATSTSFGVTAGPAAALAFVVQPSNVITGAMITPAIQVKIVDAGGNIVVTATDAVTLSFNGAIDALLGGTKTVAAVNGVATFSDITVSPALSGIALKAAATGLTAAVSSTFDALPVPGALHTWLGNISTDWHDAGNWSPASVPAAQDSVTIPSATNSPIITTNAYAKAILVENGGSLGINTATTVFLSTDTISNKGTLTLTSAVLLGSVVNHGTVVVDSTAIAGSLMNYGTVNVTSTKAGGAVLEATAAIVNAGQIQLDDSNGGQASLFAVDSLVNTSTGTLAVNQGAGGQRTIAAPLRNYGALTVASTYGLFLTNTVEQSSAVNTGSMTFTGGGDFYLYFTDTMSVFTNTGTIALGGSLLETLNGKVVLRNGTMTGTGLLRSYSSVLDIDFSKAPWPLRLDAGSRFAGTTLNVPAGQTVTLTGSTIEQPVSVSGTLRVMDTLSYDVVMFQAGATINAGGVLDAQGDVQMNDAFAVAQNGTLRVTSTGGFNRAFFSAKPFTNDGQIEMTSTSAGLAVLDVNGKVTNSTTGTITALGGLGGERRIEAQLDNKGAVIVAADGYLTLQSTSAASTNSGTIILEDAPTPEVRTAEHLTSFVVSPFAEVGSTLTSSGTIMVGANRTLSVPAPSALGNAGLIVGTGTISVPTGATFSNNGTINPGKQGVAGTLTYDGNFDMGTGVVEIDIATLSTDLTSGDLLQVTGSATLGTGTVKVIPTPEFVNAGGVHLAISALKGCSGFPTLATEGWAIDTQQTCVRVAPIIGLLAPAPRAAPFTDENLFSKKQR